MDKTNKLMEEIENHYVEKTNNQINKINNLIKNSSLECENVEYFILSMTKKQLDEGCKVGEYRFNFPIKNIEKYSFRTMCPEHFKRLSHFFRSRIYESNNISELKNPLSQVKIKTNSMYDKIIDVQLFY